MINDLRKFIDILSEDERNFWKSVRKYNSLKKDSKSIDAPPFEMWQVIGEPPRKAAYLFGRYCYHCGLKYDTSLDHFIKSPLNHSYINDFKRGYDEADKIRLGKDINYPNED